MFSTMTSTASESTSLPTGPSAPAPARSAHVARPAVTAVLAASVALCGAFPALGQANPDRIARDAAKVQETYLVGPAAAMELGCNIAWQASVPLPSGQELKSVHASNDGVLALNTRNELTLVRSKTGDRAWTASAAQQVDRVLALNIVRVLVRGAEEPRIMVTTDTVSYGLDFKDGASVTRGRFRHVPNTAPTVVGRRLVFGTRDGQVSWFDCATGFELLSYTVDGPEGKSPINAAPAVANGIVVSGSSRGTLVGLDAVTGVLRWRKELLAGVSAPPAIANGIAFVASEDQYLYAASLDTGKTLWKYFTQVPLRSAPFATGSLVLQDIPGEGLVAFTQNPEGQLGGEVRWKRAGLAGKPIGSTTCGGAKAVMLWCGSSRTMTMVDLRNGDVIRTVPLPKVEHIEADSLEAGGFVAWSSDGRIIRLSPVTAPENTNSAAPTTEKGR